MIDYATGREMPADKLTVRDVRNFKADAPKRNALRIAKLKHAGDWNVAPQAIPNLMDALRKPPFRFDVVVTQKDLFPAIPTWSTTRSSTSTAGRPCRFPRKTWTPCASISSPAAARSSPTPPAAARPSMPRSAASSPSCSPIIPWSRSRATTSSLPSRSAPTSQDVQYTKGAGGGRDFPQLEGVKINDHWVDHLFQIRHRLRSRAAHRHRVQRLYLRKCAQDRRQHRDLLDAALIDHGFDR